MAWSGHLTGVLIVAIVVLGPVWLSLHYRSQRHATRTVDIDRKLDELVEMAARLQSRIETLEGLLESRPEKEGQ
jgi:phage shock protein B